jgi:carboxyl-terminal processing protease
MKLQMIACAVAIATGGLFFSHTINEAFAATEAPVVSTVIKPSQEQALATSEVAKLADRQHYLNMRLDAATSSRILDMYLDSLDPDHSLFLSSEIVEYKNKYGSNFGTSLKTGNLTGPFAIHEQYRERLKQFYVFMLAELKQPQNLQQKDVYLDLNREKAAYFKTTAEQRAHWQKMLVSQLISLTISKEEEQAKQRALKADPSLANGQDLTGPEDLTPVQTLTKRYTRQLERIGRVKSDDVLDKTLNAMLATYDPHSNYYPPAEAAELNRQMTLKLIGIGVQIRPERGNEDYTKIENIVEGGPSSKSGQVKVGDRIIGVAQDGEKMLDVVGWSSGEVANTIRGKLGTKVTIRLLSSGASISQARNVTLVRDVIKQDDARVRSRTIEVIRDGKKHVFGVVEIPSFYEDYRARNVGMEYYSVSADTANALKLLKAKNVEGILVDLRNNPGGSLTEVIRMVGQVIKSGPVVQVRNGQGIIDTYYDPDNGKQIYAGPLAVLINLASASASEIYSAAIQDYERGIIIGSTTTGKGTAQAQFDSLAHGQATLTQRKFYRVTGGSTQNKGVIPDIKLIDIYNGEFGERKSKNALKWDTIPTAPFKRQGSVRPYITKLTQSSEQRVAVDSQFNYLEARKLIAQKGTDQKQVELDINQRRAELIDLEKQSLNVENQRRVATGQAPYANWESYQASIDALSESRGKMKASQRPALPEDEAFVTEAANVLIDYTKLQGR